MAAPAAAETTLSRTIHIDRSQLTSPEGVAAIYHEVVEAARAVCNDAGGPSARRACVDDAIATGLGQAAIPELVAYHAAQSEMQLALASPR